MNAPNRVNEVEQIIAPYLPFPQGEQNDPYRLGVLTGIIIPALNRLDGGKWGCLTKTDQGGKVPCDILVWKDTNETIDALTGKGAFWDNQGPNTNPAWVWTAVADPAPGTGGTGTGAGQVDPPAPVPAGPTNADVLARLDVLEANLTAKVQEVSALIDHLNQRLVVTLTPVIMKIMG